MPRTCIRPLTYAPKIPGVLEGTIRQTIRVGQRLATGDRVLFHGWEGKPYRSKWSFRTPYYVLIAVLPIRIRPDGLLFESSGEVRPWADLDEIAVLLGMHAVPESGVPGQILRW